MAKLPALDPQTLPEKRTSSYPEPFRSRMGDRAKRRLGDACGLTRLGVNLVTLGAAASRRCGIGTRWRTSSSMC